MKSDWIRAIRPSGQAIYREEDQPILKTHSTSLIYKKKKQKKKSKLLEKDRRSWEDLNPVFG